MKSIIRTRPVVFQPRISMPATPFAIRDFVLGLTSAAAVMLLLQQTTLREEQRDLRIMAAQIQQVQSQKPVEAKYVRPEPFEMEPRLIPLGDRRKDVCIQTAWRW